ncbi:hypothetical protein SAMN05216567_106282 [Variovorax sp. OK605]|nr:hypothetical protein SAMN05216567_106282 [Variovorax sp. OK605]
MTLDGRPAIALSTPLPTAAMHQNTHTDFSTLPNLFMSGRFHGIAPL